MLESPGNGSLSVPDRRLTTSWPLRWELRAVDATRRRGWVWPGQAAAGPNPATLPPAARVVVYEEAPPGALVLLASRAIYDNGAMVSRSPDLGVVTPAPFVELHPDEAAARGLVAGSEVTVSPANGAGAAGGASEAPLKAPDQKPEAPLKAPDQKKVRAPLRISTDTPRGAAAVWFDQPGMAANVLLDSSSTAAYVTVAP